MADPKVTGVTPSVVRLRYSGRVQVVGEAFKDDTIIFFDQDTAVVLDRVGSSEINVEVDARITGNAGTKMVWAHDPTTGSGSPDQGDVFEVRS